MARRRAKTIVRQVKTSSEVTYDGNVRTGLVIRSENGFEAHSEGYGYLETFVTHREATKAIFDRHRYGTEEGAG